MRYRWSFHGISGIYGCISNVRSNNATASFHLFCSYYPKPLPVYSYNSSRPPLGSSSGMRLLPLHRKPSTRPHGVSSHQLTYASYCNVRSGTVVCTVGHGCGISGTSASLLIPNIAPIYDPRGSI